MLFGTDGVRGLASYFFEGKLAYRIGKALASRASRPQKVVIARDTRVSGFDIEQEVIDGLLECGAEVVRLEILPTMTVSNIVKRLKADYGVMISASHNPPQYNGIKIFDHTGQKLSLDEENEIEKEIFRGESLAINIKNCNILKRHDICNTLKNYEIEDTIYEEKEKKAPTSSHCAYKKGKIINFPCASEIYIDDILRRLGADFTLKGCAVKLDCAYGACAKLAPRIFQRVGAQVKALADEHDGALINVKTGSTNIEFLKLNMASLDTVGFAFDGDGDRVLAVAPDGGTIDGDRMLYVLTLYLKKLGLLKHNAVVGTLMSNIGLECALNQLGISLIRTDVGDKYVIEKMRECGFVLGGETSGHIILNENGDGETGDGILAALMFMKALNELEIPIERTLSLYRAFPQKTLNIQASGAVKTAILNDAGLIALKELCEEELSDTGRVLIRPSGTEDKIRITVEASRESAVNDVIELLGIVYSEAVEKYSAEDLGAPSS